MVTSSLSTQDLYVDRPLPYLIGSQAFMEQDDVGLGDPSSDGNATSTPAVTPAV